MKNIYAVALLIGLYSLSAFAQFPAECDKDKACIGRALEQTVTSGRGLQFVDVTRTTSQNALSIALTVELWMRPEKQAGRQYIAGFWGPHSSPNDDKNDVWVLYITPDDNLVFEVNGGAANLGATDNTIVRTALPAGWYGEWNHVAAVFNGATQQATIYINGQAVDSARNAAFPAQQLHKPENSALGLQVAGANAVSDDDSYRTFKGRLDEIRVWSSALTASEVLCRKDISLAGNEAGLVLYYRCNEPDNEYYLCDATGNGNTGTWINGGSFVSAGRQPPYTTEVLPASVTADLLCDSTAAYVFSVRDTSVCGGTWRVRMAGRDAGMFSVAPSSLVFVPGGPAQTVTVTVSTKVVGSIRAELQLNGPNRCSRSVTVPLTLNRKAELDYSLSRVEFDTLYAGCRERLYSDTTITITNNSAVLGQPRAVSVVSVATGMPQVFTIISNPTPVTLQPGESASVRVRFLSRDSSATYFDTLRVVSTDRCNSLGFIPLTGIVKEVLAIRSEDGSARIDSMDFGKVCPGQLSAPMYWIWLDSASRPIVIDSIAMPASFVGRSIRFPVTLQPNTGYTPNFFRFRPVQPGWVQDSIVFYTRIDGCTIERKVYVRGYGYSSDVEFTIPDIDFGDVIVGQSQTLTVSARNNGTDTLRVSFYLEVGEAFYLTGGAGREIAPGETVQLPITFVPFTDSVFVDKLCLYEQRCYTVTCIPVRGRGVLEAFEFRPDVMRTTGVLSCRSELDTIYVKNISTVSQTLTNVRLDDPTGSYTAVNPALPIPSLSLAPGAEQPFIVRFTPYDQTQDIAVRAFLRYETGSSTRWAAQLYGTSSTPKLFITPLTVYGTVEVSDTQTQDVLVENISAFTDLTISAADIALPAGYSLAATSVPLPATLRPRQSFTATVAFTPAAEINYNGAMRIALNQPCVLDATGELRGKGEIIQLESPISLVNFSFVRPCDCKTREIPLINRSLAFPMTIDSLWIDGQDSALFSWTSQYSAGVLPYEIPAGETDTVRLTYCPRSPAEPQYIDNEAIFHIQAHGSNWAREYLTGLSGKRSLVFLPTPTLAVFPPTNVDTLSAPRFVSVVIPGVTINPDREPVVVDSVTFEPNDRVFTASDRAGRPFPITVNPGDTLTLRVDFRPRVPREYEARMVIHTSKPCADRDTTVLVQGSGSALFFALDFTYERNRTDLDTFRIHTCDTLVVPVFSSRNIPADLVDIRYRLSYDTTGLQFVDALSPYLLSPCPPYTPSVQATPSTGMGLELLHKNFCKVDSTQPFALLRFVSKTGQRGQYTIRLDSITFDSEEVILYRIIAGGDLALVIVDQPEFRIQNTAVFDSVRILECVERQVDVLNTGDVPLSIADIALPIDIELVSSVPDTGQLFAPGQTARLTVRFCPQRAQVVDTMATALSKVPCSLLDSTLVTGVGYAPDFPVRFAFSPDFNTPAAFTERIGDTVVFPLYVDVDFSVQYGDGPRYWLRNFDFDVRMNYNPRALKFLSATSVIAAPMSVGGLHGSQVLSFTGADSLRAGQIASLTFLVTVPDTVLNTLALVGENFATDSLMFINIVPEETEGLLTTDDKCTISYVRYTDVQAGSLRQNTPNPFSDETAIEFSIQETVPVVLKVYAVNGELAKVLLDGSKVMKGGTYRVEFDVHDLQPGVYYYVLEAGIFRASRPMTIVK